MNMASVGFLTDCKVYNVLENQRDEGKISMDASEMFILPAYEQFTQVSLSELLDALYQLYLSLSAVYKRKTGKENVSYEDFLKMKIYKHSSLKLVLISFFRWDFFFKENTA